VRIGGDRGRRTTRRIVAGVVAGAALGAFVPAVAAAAAPIHAIWSGPGFGHTQVGFITNETGTEVDNLGGTLTKPDVDPVTPWPGECGLPAGPYDDLVIFPDGSFQIVNAPGIQGSVTIEGRFTSPVTAVGTYSFTYDCARDGPGPIEEDWHAVVIDDLRPTPAPTPSPTPTKPALPALRLPGHRGHRLARLCARAIPARGVFERGRHNARQACTRWAPLHRGHHGAGRADAARNRTGPPRAGRADAARNRTGPPPAGRADATLDRTGPPPAAMDACLPVQHAQRAEPGGFVTGYEGRGEWCRRVPLALRLEVRGRRHDVALGTLAVTERLTDRSRRRRAGPVHVRRLSYQLEWQPRVRLTGPRVRLHAACTLENGHSCGADARATAIASGRSVQRNVSLRLPAARKGERRHASTRYRLELTARQLPHLGAVRGALVSPAIRGARHGTAKTWVFPAFTPTIGVSESPQGGMPAIVAHMKRAQAAGKPGAPGTAPLQKVGDETQRKNRDIACSDRKRAAWPGGWPPGASCEEYPFASTRQGGHGALIAPVPLSEQRVQGGVLNTAYDRLQILPGDRFWVTAVP
jgi:Deoxyribonuclease NucA/NucB